MPVHATADEDGSGKIAEWVSERFAKGLAASIGRADGRIIYLIPESVAVSGSNSLIIAQEGGGCYVYSGDKELNEYKLVQAGFSLQVAIEVSKIVNALMTQYTLLKKPRKADIDLLKLTHQEGDNDE